MKYRKKPVVINAWKCYEILRDAEVAWVALPKEVKDAYERGDFLFTDNSIHVKTLEGLHIIVGVEDMLIQGIKGEFYGCKPDIFEATYEPVEPT